VQQPAERSDHSLVLELTLLSLLALAWGSSYALTKIALQSITPLTAVSARVLLAAGLLWALLLWLGRSVPRDAATWRLLFVQGLLQSTIPFTMITWGQQYVDSGLTGVLNSTSPIFVTAITLLWTRHERISAIRLAGLLIGLAGVLLIVGVEAMAGMSRGFAGQVAIVLATIGFAFAAIWGRKFSHIPVEVTAAGTLLAGGLTLLPFALVLETPWTLQPSSASVIALTVQAAFGGAVGFLLYFRLVRTIGSLGVSSVAYLKAAVSVLIGVVMLGEPLKISLAVGLAAVIVGVAMLNTRSDAGQPKQREQRAPAE
jgi:drug/metabolite transporter (DMT)-like permease